ncbi:MAG: DUF4837 family protein [Bacteroidales bacterium]|jgi:hypothetical protein|nr:DUF4837 family protein [Bacteroidales bacterium]MBQ5857333.1 DUF4837 family protein [Bacteroidales bacterium]
MKNIRFIAAMLVILVSFSSCVVDEKAKETSKARSVGGSSEILMVTQNDEQWKGQMGQAVRDFFEQEQYGLPQPEKNFKVAHINLDALNDMFKKHRNLIIAKIDKDIKNPLVETQRNLDSEPQFVIRITASSPESWVRAFETQKDGLKLIFDNNERKRFQEYFRPMTDSKIVAQLKKKFGITMNIPEGYNVAANGDNCMWLLQRHDDKDMSFLIYELPYKDTADLNLDNIINVRDSIVKKYIPGPLDGSYMTTDKEFVKPVSKVLPNFPAGYAVETRGMWNVVGDFMAGPFLSYSIVDPTSSKIVTAEGWIYYPNKEKRDLLRQQESILYSLKFVE